MYWVRLCPKLSLIMVTYSSLVPSISPNQGLHCSNGWTSGHCLPLLVWLSVHCSFHLLVIFRPYFEIWYCCSGNFVSFCNRLFEYISAVVFPLHPECHFIQKRETVLPVSFSVSNFCRMLSVDNVTALPIKGMNIVRQPSVLVRKYLSATTLYCHLP